MKKKNKYILSKNLHYFIRKDFENSVNLQDNTIRFTLHCLWTSLFSLFVHRSVLKGTKKLKAAFPRPASFQSLVKRCWRRGRGRGTGLRITSVLAEAGNSICTWEEIRDVLHVLCPVFTGVLERPSRTPANFGS